MYDYQCEACGLQFEQKEKASNASKPVECSGCGKDAPRMVPDTFSSTYQVTGDGTIMPQNTGVSSYDANVDRVIGSHSDTSWKAIQKRHSRKRDVLRSNPTKDGFDLGRTVDHDYRIMKSSEKDAAQTARDLHTEALGRISRWKKKRDESGEGTAGS